MTPDAVKKKPASESKRKPRVLQSVSRPLVAETNFKYCDTTVAPDNAAKVDTDSPKPAAHRFSLPFSALPRPAGPPDHAGLAWILVQQFVLLPDIYIYIVNLLPAPAVRRQKNVSKMLSKSPPRPPSRPPPCKPMDSSILLAIKPWFSSPPRFLFHLYSVAFAAICHCCSFAAPLLSNLSLPSLLPSPPTLCRLTACLPT